MEAGPTSAAMASSDMGAWVPSAITAVQCARPSADSLFDGPEEQGQRAVPGAVGDDHAERATGEVQCGDLCAHERANLLGVEHLSGPSQRHRHRPAPSTARPLCGQPLPAWTRPRRRTRCAPRATATELAARPSPRPGGGTEILGDRILQAGKRHATHLDARHAAAIQMAATMANVVVSSDLARRAATTGSRRWGNLLDPSAPTWAQVWPSAGLANRRNASSANAAGCSAAGNAATSSVSSTSVPHEAGDDGICHGALRWWRARPAGRRRPRRSAGR